MSGRRPKIKWFVTAEEVIDRLREEAAQCLSVKVIRKNNCLEYKLKAQKTKFKKDKNQKTMASSSCPSININL